MHETLKVLTLVDWSGRHTEAPVCLFCPVAPPDLDIGSSVPEVKLPPQPPRELRVDMRELVYSLPVRCDRELNGGVQRRDTKQTYREAVGKANAYILISAEYLC